MNGFFVITHTLDQITYHPETFSSLEDGEQHLRRLVPNFSLEFDRLDGESWAWANQIEEDNWGGLVTPRPSREVSVKPCEAVSR